MRSWLLSYWLLVRWNLLRLRSTLPLLIVVQTLLGVAVVIGFSFLVPQTDSATVLYLSTGAATTGLITVGMVVLPQMVAQQKLTGIFDYVRAMPVPRLAMLAADASVWIAVAVPGLAASLGVAALRFDLSFAVSPLFAVALFLVAASSVGAGYTIGYLTKPAVTGLITQLIVIVAMMFAPVNFPADRLPGWLAATHRWLPFTYMAQVVRETLNVPPTGIAVLPFAVLLAGRARHRLPGDGPAHVASATVHSGRTRHGSAGSLREGVDTSASATRVARGGRGATVRGVKPPLVAAAGSS
jgi:ABC-2 type transport system permease protein